MKIVVKLRDDLAKAGMGFSDIEAKQEIRHKPGETVEVEQTPFMQKRIETGEVIVVSTASEESEKSDPDSDPADPDGDADTTSAGSQDGASSGNGSGRGGRRR